jgi:hypothetical protein
MSVYLSPVGGAGAQFFDNNGNPLTGGKLFTYLAGTTTPQITYTSSTGATAHSNPIILDAAGRVPGSSEIWLVSSANYKFVLKTSDDVLLATWDNIPGVASGSASIENFSGTGSQTVYFLTRAPLDENSTNVYINGVYQQKNTYTVTATTLTFSEAPPSNTTIEVSYF